MTHVSLFSGIGGLDLAAEWAGFETVLFCERDPYCQKVLRKHWPDVPIIEDIREVKSESVREPVDVISGGFPCQPFSNAGKRRGTADDRFLWPEMLRVISEIKPRFVVAENVPGLLSIDAGLVFERVLSEMESIGYEVLPLHYPAAGVGAPHKRDRVFIIAHVDDSEGRGCGFLHPENIGQASGNVNALGDASKICADVPDALLLNDDLGGHGAGEICGERSGQADISGRENVADTDTARLERKVSTGSRPGKSGLLAKCDWWDIEPDVGRVAHGVPSRVDRLRALGNSVVPQQAYPIFKAIAETIKDV